MVIRINRCALISKKLVHGGNFSSIRSSLKYYSTLESLNEQINDEADRNEQEQSPSRRGTKIKPSKTNFLVLNPMQAGLLKKRRLPEYFNNTKENKKISILEGVDIDKPLISLDEFDRSLTEKKNSFLNNKDIDDLREIQSQTRKLLVFTSDVSNEQILKSINYQKPLSNDMSQKRYDQLKHLLDSAYTVAQLRAYTKTYFNLTSSRAVKKTLIKKILDDLWKCKINTSINETDDLIVEKIIDISTRDMYLLLLTNNGKILHNLTRIGAVLAVALDENKIIVRATSSIIKYLEVSLNKILSNVNSELVPVDEIIKNHMDRGKESFTDDDKRNLISLIQKETGCFFEKQFEEALGEKQKINNQESDQKEHLVSALGRKKIFEAKKLLMWGMEYKPQLLETVKFVGDPSLQYKKYPFTGFDCLDWINKNRNWYRSQIELPLLPKSNDSIVNNSVLKLSDENIFDCYDFIKGKNDPGTTMAQIDAPPAEISTNISLTLGQILHESNNEQNYIFQPKIPNITKKLLKLQLFNEPELEDTLYNVDQHEYYVQLKFIPNLKELSKYADISKLNLPPLDLWFELDENDNAIPNTLQSFLKLKEKRLLLEASTSQYDYRIDNDKVLSLTKPFDGNSDNWLSDQPGIRKFLENSKLAFGTNKKLVVPESLSIQLRLLTDSTPEGYKDIDVEYQFINTSYHRILKLKYMEKYLVQFSHVYSGNKGGRYTQVDFIGDGTELDDKAKFQNFVEDISKLN